MSEHKHTTGPWRVGYDHGAMHIFAGKDSLMCDESYYPWVPENKSDWDLIAAAPDLLAAATAMRDHLDKWQEAGSIATPEESKVLYDALSAAITKATGEAI